MFPLLLFRNSTGNYKTKRWRTIWMPAVVDDMSLFLAILGGVASARKCLRDTTASWASKSEDVYIGSSLADCRSTSSVRAASEQIGFRSACPSAAIAGRQASPASTLTTRLVRRRAPRGAPASPASIRRRLRLHGSSRWAPLALAEPH